MCDYELLTETPEDIENREKFFGRLKGRLTDEEYNLLDFAYDAAKYGHRNQQRDDGTRYFEHCRETAIILMDEFGIYDPHMIMAALLHDMLEDSFLLNPWRLERAFGWKVAHLVVPVSKPKKGDPRFKSNNERHRFYFKTIKEAMVLIKILKLADRLHNLRTLYQCDAEKRQRKIKETIDVYMPLIEDVIATVNHGYYACFDWLQLDYQSIGHHFVSQFQQAFDLLASRKAKESGS